MATAPPANHRASLLSGLRTGGVRSTSTNIPHTAAIGGSFSIPRFASSIHQPYQEEYEDSFGDLPPTNAYATYAGNNNNFHNGSMTAAVDGPGFSQQQTNRGMNPNSAPFQPSFNHGDMFGQQIPQQNQAFQMQMMQLEILRLQSIQAQQYQAELLAAQAQTQQQQQQQLRRPSYNPPATAGPLTTSFDRSNGVRKPQSISQLNPRFGEEVPLTPGATTVISGGTALGVSGSSPPPVSAPSKSDAATSWRRGGNNNSVLSGQNRSLAFKLTPPAGDKPASPPLSGGDVSPPRSRPQPLRFAQTSEPIAVVVSDSTDGDDADSLGSSKSNDSSPITSRTPSSNGSPTGLSPREEAAKKLYAGLGVGRPTPTPPIPALRPSMPTRQPRGPPSGIEELGPKNFASRIRRQAIGGLSALMGARERREVEAY